jgi:hypothetical protein
MYFLKIQHRYTVHICVISGPKYMQIFQYQLHPRSRDPARRTSLKLQQPQANLQFETAATPPTAPSAAPMLAFDAALAAPPRAPSTIRCRTAAPPRRATLVSDPALAAPPPPSRRRPRYRRRKRTPPQPCGGPGGGRHNRAASHDAADAAAVLAPGGGQSLVTHPRDSRPARGVEPLPARALRGVRLTTPRVLRHAAPLPAPPLAADTLLRRDPMTGPAARTCMIS